MPSYTLNDLVDEVESYVREAVDILSSGDYVELHQLEDKVRNLCQHVAGLPLHEAKEAMPKLESLTKQLDLLRSIMLEHKQKVAGDLHHLSTKQRASHAYAKSDSMLPKNGG